MTRSFHLPRRLCPTPALLSASVLAFAFVLGAAMSLATLPAAAAASDADVNAAAGFPSNPGPGALASCRLAGVEFRFRYAPAGSFMMGAPLGEEDREEDELAHDVTLTRGFWILETPVTLGMWRAFVDATGYVADAGLAGLGPAGWSTTAPPRLGEGWQGQFAWSARFRWDAPGFTQREDSPATCVSFNDASAFCEWLGAALGRECRIPTEAQWEYAARAGTTTRFFFGDDADDFVRYGNAADASARRLRPDWTWTSEQEDAYAFTSPVGSYQPNAWGVRDMLGNVGEWTADWYAAYPAEDAIDPTGPAAPTGGRVLRGGGWSDPVAACRVANRRLAEPASQTCCVGFRVVAHDSDGKEE